MVPRRLSFVLFWMKDFLLGVENLNISEINPFGLLLMIIAAVLVYGAKFIMEEVFKITEEHSMQRIIYTKLAGLLIGIIGLLIAMKII